MSSLVCPGFTYLMVSAICLGVFAGISCDASQPAPVTESAFTYKVISVDAADRDPEVIERKLNNAAQMGWRYKDRIPGFYLLEKKVQDKE